MYTLRKLYHFTALDYAVETVRADCHFTNPSFMNSLVYEQNIATPVFLLFFLVLWTLLPELWMVPLGMNLVTSIWIYLDLQTKHTWAIDRKCYNPSNWNKKEKTGGFSGCVRESWTRVAFPYGSWGALHLGCVKKGPLAFSLRLCSEVRWYHDNGYRSFALAALAQWCIVPGFRGKRVLHVWSYSLT